MGSKLKGAANMTKSHEYDRFRFEVQPALQSKLEEFNVLGYGSINEEELWGYLTNKKWKKVKEDVRLYEIVDDILSVKLGEYMSYATLEAFKSPDVQLESEEDFKELFK